MLQPFSHMQCSPERRFIRQGECENSNVRGTGIRHWRVFNLVAPYYKVLCVAGLFEHCLSLQPFTPNEQALCAAYCMLHAASPKTTQRIISSVNASVSCCT